ncbi:MAG TPA: DUF4388 domain-containing protein, partial [Myxococcota bacterium]
LGTLKQMSVTEIIQMLEIGKKSARIEVQWMAAVASLAGTGVIHMHDGQIVACSAGAELGEAAVLALCRMKDGFFRIHYEREAVAKNVTRPTTFVLLEAMRQIDETSPQAPAPPAPALADAPTQLAPQAQGKQPPSTKPEIPRTMTPPQRPRPGLARAPAASPGPAHDAFATLPPRNKPERTSSGSMPRPVSGFGGALPNTMAEARGDHTLELADGIERDIERDPHPTLPNKNPWPMAPQTFPPPSGPSRGHNSALDDVTLRETPLPGAGPALLRRLKEVIAAGNQALAPVVVRIHPRLLAVPPLSLAAAAALVFVVLLAILVALVSGPRAALSYPAAHKALLAGHPSAVVASLGNLAPAERSALQTLALADADAILHDDDHAIPLYSAAVAGGETDGIALAYLTGRLDASEPDDEIDLLVLWPDRDVDEVLAPLTLSVRTLLRQNAIAVLVERGALSRILSEEQSAILDLMPKEGTCTSRRIALHVLEAVGKTRHALDTVDRVGHAEDPCFQLAEVSAAYKAVKKRI